jgi:hypothetical protein
MRESLKCRNISRNSLHRVMQRHEILDRSANATEKERGEHLHGRGSTVRVRQRALQKPRKSQLFLSA